MTTGKGSPRCFAVNPGNDVGPTPRGLKTFLDELQSTKTVTGAYGGLYNVRRAGLSDAHILPAAHLLVQWIC